MAASHTSLEAAEPKSSKGERAAETERPSSAAVPISSSSDARLQAALSATSRADASLSTLMRAVRDLTSGVSSAREANVALVSELGALADLLAVANERQLALKNRVALLEQTLAKSEKEAAKERDYILEQQDAFIAGMLEDHEHVVAELRREIDVTRERLSQRPTASPSTSQTTDALSATALAPPRVPATEPAPAPDLRFELEETKRDVDKLLAERERMRETLLKLQAQRDEAQASVVKLTRERDLARAEGAQNRIGDAVRQAIPVHTPTPTPAGRMSSTQPPESPRARTPSSPSNPVASSKPLSSKRRSQDGAGKSERTTQPMPVGITRPRAPSLDLTPREQRIPSPPPEELAAALHPPTTPLPPAPLLTPAPVTPRGPEARLEKPSEKPAPETKKNKPETSPRPVGGYSLTNSVAPERVNTSAVSRPPRR
jgi:predicted nuclease with TOPRIM domain